MPEAWQDLGLFCFGKQLYWKIQDQKLEDECPESTRTPIWQWKKPSEDRWQSFSTDLQHKKKINFFVLPAMKLIRFSHYTSVKSYHLCNFLNSLYFLFYGTFCAAQCHSHFAHRLWQREYIFSPEQTALSCSFPHWEADTTQIKMHFKLALEVLCFCTDLSAFHYYFITNKKGGTSSTFPVYTSHNWTKLD